MKKKMYLFWFAIAIFLLGSIGCHKSILKTDAGCGCNTDSVWHYATYDNFGGFSYNAWLLYVTQNDQNAWFMSVQIPNTNEGAICKICNPNLPAIKAYTDTSSKMISIPVHFAGKLKKLCINESWGFTTLPETLLAYIIIDSLKKN